MVSTKGIWYPDRNKATEKDPPLYLHVTAPTAEILKKAVDKIEELMNMDLGSLAEEKRREKVGGLVPLFFCENNVLTVPVLLRLNPA